ncbi:MAG: type II toxin-antitoxin system prevent-host-death family antitoxin [Blastocatellia bacterium]
MKLVRDIQSLSTFKRDTARFLKQMRKTKQPLVLTVNGTAAIVVQDAESYQELLDAKERIEAIEGIQRGLDSLKGGRSRTANEFFGALFAKHNISEE